MTTEPGPLLAAASRGARLRRVLWDVLIRRAVAVGGVGVIGAIALIFFYLVYVVAPLFVPASMAPLADYPVPTAEAGRTLLLDVDELDRQAVRYTDRGRVIFFDLRSGTVLRDSQLPVGGARVTAVARAGSNSHLVALGLSDGNVLLVRHGFVVSYPNDVRTITPSLDFPFGREPLSVDGQGRALEHLAVRDGDGRVLLAAVSDDGETWLGHYRKQAMGDDVARLTGHAQVLQGIELEPRYVLLGPGLQRLYLADGYGRLAHFQLQPDGSATLYERVQLTDGQALRALSFLVGGYSLLAAADDGRIWQWFPVRDVHNRFHLQRIREFDAQHGPVVALAAERRRKGFVAVDSRGQLGLYHSTAHRTLLVQAISKAPLIQVALSPRADTVLAQDADGQLHLWAVHNEHPEVSWTALWGKVWYEGYEQPRYVWQSSAASNEFEPKFSLTPLTFGTLKAAFYAMLLAVPLAVCGAVFTAYFMAPPMRSMVKPTIEIMEALPTVILGFLAGLWLAPVVEAHLPGIFSLLIVLPVGIVAFAFAWHSLPAAWRGRVPEGWEAALLVPVVLLLGWLSMALSSPLETLLFGGNMRTWLSSAFGMGFDQRNSLVVGLAMGFAVIPTIFSIAEDAIFSVPKHLTFGSLALGATPWQSLSRVVLLTASPGIFSAVMIGMGRAVGETMIVLMATGNTPVMDLSIFQGMRTLSANIAVELPESAVGSTHYRVLFLAALVLFLFTFVANTVAELVRQRLRRKYSSL